ncbi:DoxX family protein [Nocardia stercoris]|uniref:DoxX family protein n=1 Tax=Nocardia stercoris TaxID=2483361 RepID=A0A3M2L9J7_9NOCA|nr:DoxX family protein [Nocardia stercoris]
MQPESATDSGWQPATRILFRFGLVYLTLFCLLYPQITYAFAGWFQHVLPERAVLWQLDLFAPVYRWIGRHVFGVDAVVHESGSGDQTVFWVLLFFVLVTALLVTAVWSVLDRRRTEYRVLAGWFLLFVRLCLAGQLVLYGMAKAIPVQMPRPALSTLLEPYGNFTPAAVLWSQVGSSQPYEILLGAAELVAGLLLFVPRTALLGTMLGVVSLAQVFVLNLTFDVPVKVLSGHLLLLGLVLLAPEARRLLNVLLLEGSAGPSTTPNPFRTVMSRRRATLAQAALALWVTLSFAVLDWHDYREATARPPLYGIWVVTGYERDGRPVPPGTDPDRWQKLIIDTAGALTYQRADGSLETTEATVDSTAHRLNLPGPDPQGTFDFRQPDPHRLELTGRLDDHPVTMTLNWLDPNSFPQRSRGFHWIQEEPAFR